MAANEHTTDAEEGSPEQSESWGYQAWRMWCAGNRNKSAIFRALKQQYGDAMPKWNDCITKAIARESKIARKALDIDETDALTEYIAGLVADKKPINHRFKYCIDALKQAVREGNRAVEANKKAGK